MYMYFYVQMCCVFMYRESGREKSLHLSSHVLHIFIHINCFMLNQTQVIPENLSKYKNGRYSELQEQRRFRFLFFFFFFLVTAF